MKDNKIENCFLILVMVFVSVLMLLIFLGIGIQLKSAYIDVQLKERLLYSGDSYIQEVNNIG